MVASEKGLEAAEDWGQLEGDNPSRSPRGCQNGDSLVGQPNLRDRIFMGTPITRTPDTSEGLDYSALSKGKSKYHALCYEAKEDFTGKANTSATLLASSSFLSCTLLPHETLHIPVLLVWALKPIGSHVPSICPVCALTKAKAQSGGPYFQP